MQLAQYVLDAPDEVFDIGVVLPAAGVGHALPDAALAQFGHKLDFGGLGSKLPAVRWPNLVIQNP